MRTHRMLSFTVVLAVLAVLGACTKVSYKPLDSSRSYDKTSEVRMFRNFPDIPYEEIGTIRAVGMNEDKLLENIRAKAMKIGAQGLVVKPVAKRTNTYEPQRLSNNFGKEEYIMEAVAIRFKKAGN